MNDAHVIVLAAMLTLGAVAAACEDAPASEVPGGAVAQAEPSAEAAAEPPTEAAPADEEPAPTETSETVAGEDSASEHFGAPFTLEGPALSLSEALATCADTGTPCKVEGTIEDVCQRRGCWFSLAAPDVAHPVRVRMLDYGFFVPTDAMGADCTMEGTLTTETVSQEIAQHYAEEAVGPGETPRVVEGPETVYELVITGVELRR